MITRHQWAQRRNGAGEDGLVDSWVLTLELCLDGPSSKHAHWHTCPTCGVHRERSGASVPTTSTMHDSILLQFCSVEFFLFLGSFVRSPPALSAPVPSCVRSASAGPLFFLPSFLFHVHWLRRFRRVRVRASSSSRSPRPTTVQRPLQIARIVLSNPVRGVEQHQERNPLPPSPHLRLGHHASRGVIG
ncbi:hypothetical protein EDB86DRAFT_474822 [Lactarius hatsudake]|nr:hypothetical protein EDB86DRAFT_474822 [Lactarius hatsudake]